MAATATGSSRRSPNGPVIRSISPAGRFHFQTASCKPSTAFASSSTNFTSRSSSFFHSQNKTELHRSNSPTRVQLQRSNSPTRVSLYGHSQQNNPSVKISTVISSRKNQLTNTNASRGKKTCMCSPTTHPGSFRCSLHKHLNSSSHHGSAQHAVNHARLNARRSAMTNSLVRIGGVEGSDLVKRALAALIRPSSHQQRRRGAFQPRPSRLSVMSKAEE